MSKCDSANAQTFEIIYLFIIQNFMKCMILMEYKTSYDSHNNKCNTLLIPSTFLNKTKRVLEHNKKKTKY